MRIIKYKTLKHLKTNNKGIIFSTDLLLGLIIFLFITAIIANLTDKVNDKILDKTEISNLEELAIETTDYLIKNPGNPEEWESNSELSQEIEKNYIIPGLAIKNKNVANGQFKDESTNPEKIIPNTIDYDKLLKIKNNYDKLINNKLFNDKLKSSIAIYPLNHDLNPITMGDNLTEYRSNIAVVNRTVKCDFLSKYVIYKFNDFQLKGNSYKKEELCNHDNIQELANHSDTRKSFWLCKSFRIYRNSLENYSYFLLFDEKISETNSYWVLDNLNNTNNKTEKLNNKIIDLNPYLENDLENKTNDIYSLHFKVPKNKIANFNGVLVAIPKNLTDNLLNDNQLKFSYFNTEEVYFILKTAYK